MAASLTIRPLDDVELGVSARLSGYSGQRVVMHWGDGAEEMIYPNRWIKHTYSTPGGYRPSVIAPSGKLSSLTAPATYLADAQIIVRPGLVPQIDVQPGEEYQQEFHMRLTLVDDGTGIATPGEIHWPTWPDDPAQVQQVWLAPGQTYRAYCQFGPEQPLTVIDHGTGRRLDTTIDVPNTAYDPDFVGRQLDSDPTGRTVEITFTVLNRPQYDPVKVRWGGWSGGSAETVEEIPHPKIGQSLVHTFTDAEIDSSLRLLTVDAWSVNKPSGEKPYGAHWFQQLPSDESAPPAPTP